MAAYVIQRLDVVDVRDPEGYAAYREMAAPAVAAYGGKFLARGGRVGALEGGWAPKRLVVLEFASVERARERWSSEEYAAAKKARQASAATNMIVVEGYHAE